MLDKDIREPLFDYLEERYSRVRIIEEKTISRSRADVMAVIEGALIGLEIKSDNDTYARLSRQVKDYDSYFDMNYVVVGKSHIQVAKHIPDYWGILIAEEDGLIIVERDAMPNPKVKLNRQLDILWRPELMDIQIRNEIPKLRGKKRSEIYDRLITKIGEEAVHDELIRELFERDYTVFDAINKFEEKQALKSGAGVKPVKKVRRRRKRSSRSKAAAKRRAHVTNYIG